MKTPESGKDTNVLRKAPKEIKKSLGRCLDRWTPVHFESCESNCPYHSEGTLCKETLHLDVLTYIQRLEETISSLGHLNETMCNEAKKGIEDLEKRLAQAERERDAANNDLKLYAGCKVCKFGDFKFTAECMDCGYDNNQWQWRGVCKENTKEDEGNA